MDYRGQVDLMRRDAEELTGPGHIIGDLRCGAQAITDLLARAEAAEARAEKAEKCIEEVNTAILLKSKTDALNAIKRWRGKKEK